MSKLFWCIFKKSIKVRRKVEISIASRKLDKLRIFSRSDLLNFVCKHVLLTGGNKEQMMHFTAFCPCTVDISKFSSQHSDRGYHVSKRYILGEIV